MYKRDPIEEDPRFKEILALVDATVEREFKDEPRVAGFCHIFWATKKCILKEKYDLDWKTPAEMNPDAIFD